MRWQGPDWTNAPTFLCFRRACVRWLVFPTPPLGGCLSTFLSVMPPVTRLHLIGAFFLDGRAQVELGAPTFLCYRRTCGGALFLLPSRWLSKHLPLRDAACDAFALDRCRLLRWQGPDWTDAPTFLCLRRACVRWLVFPTPPFGGYLRTFLPVMPPMTRCT